MEKQKLEKIIKFLSEIEVLKRIDHEGPRLVGVTKLDSVAEHAALSSQIAYVLAKLEGADVLKCLTMIIFHDNEEVRIGDHHRVSKRYVDIKEAEREAEKDHYSRLPDEIGNEIFQLQEELRERKTKEAIIAKDADWLEQAIQSKIYVETGYKGCEKWIDNVEAALGTDSAKEILAEIKKNPDFLNLWWQDLRSMSYDKETG